MSIVSFVGGVIADKLFLGKKIDKLLSPSDSEIIDDLKEYEECMARFEQEQNAEGEWNPTDSAEDMKLLYAMFDFENKYNDWLSIDPETPPTKRAKRRREEAIKSISLIRQFGCKVGEEIRKGLKEYNG